MHTHKTPTKQSRTNSRSRMLELASQSIKSTAKPEKSENDPGLSTPLVSDETPPAIVRDVAKPAAVILPETSAKCIAFTAGGQPPGAPRYFGSAPERKLDSRPPSPAKVRKYMDRMERNGWIFSYNSDCSKSITNLAYATMSDGGLLKQLSSGQVLDCARRLLPMTKVAECAGIVASFAFETPVIDNGEDDQTGLKAAKAAVNEAKNLLEMLALRKNGFDDEARGIEEALDIRIAAEQLVDGLEFANGRLRSMEADKTVYSHVLRETIPAAANIGARNVHRFLANADGPIKLETLCGWCEWVIQVITDDFGGETLYLITNEDWSDMSCFTGINAAKTHFVEKVIFSTRERIDREIANKLNPPPAPAASGKDDDDIPF